MDQYFSRMKDWSTNKELPSRIRFMLMDVIELRGSKVGEVCAVEYPPTLYRAQNKGQSSIGLCGLCRHNFEHNRYAKASSIMPA